MSKHLEQFTKHANATKAVTKLPSESKLQAKCVTDLRNFYKGDNGRLVCINNNSEDGFKGGQMKAMGVIKGASDTFWIGEAGTVIWIEFKRGKTGRQSDHQIEWQEMVESLGHRYELVRDYAHFWQIIDRPNPNPAFTLF